MTGWIVIAALSSSIDPGDTNIYNEDGADLSYPDLTKVS